MEDHKELVDSVMIVLDVAKDEIAGRDLQLSSIGFLQGLLLQAKDHIRFGQSLEATFAGLLFECALGATGDRSATHLDDYWMGIIGNVVLMLLERRYDKSPSRVKRLRQYFDAKISPRQGPHCATGLPKNNRCMCYAMT